MKMRYNSQVTLSKAVHGGTHTHITVIEMRCDNQSNELQKGD